MRAKFVNEITKAEDDWANAQIDAWRESQKSSKEDLEEYNQKIVNHIWKRVRTKLSPEYD
jgi:vacuolar-type H+-ATPase subunit H